MSTRCSSGGHETRGNGRWQWGLTNRGLMLVASIALIAQARAPQTATAGMPGASDRPTGDARSESAGWGGIGSGANLASREGPRVCGEAGSACTCISANERAEVEQIVAENRRRLGLAEDNLVQLAAAPYRLFPMAGSLDRDRFHTNFVDLDQGSGILDYACSSISYDGHQGIDTTILRLEAQEVGVPIYAALDGTVVYTHDGEPDGNRCVCGSSIPGWPQCPPGTAGNAVIIDHGGGHTSWYWHMKTGSVAVSVGQTVTAGQPLGLVASSGCSTGPHLHFESRLANGSSSVHFDPNSGPCNQTSSRWVQQEPLDPGLKVLGFAVSRTNPTEAQSWLQLPTTNQKALSDPFVYFWIQLGNIPANVNWQVRFIRPNGTTAFTSSLVQESNQKLRLDWWWWYWNIAELQQVPGTWSVQLNINGATVVTAPFLVVASIDPHLNRAPEPVSAAILPAQPNPGDALTCSVSGPFPIADPDFNPVFHRWVWKVGTNVVRDVTTAARSDILRRGLVSAGQTVVCEVTPTDGLLQAPKAMASVPVANPCSADLNGDQVVTGADLGIMLGEWGRPGSTDLNGDGATTGADLGLLLGKWGACP